jgi:hypothetical protein
MKLIIRLMAISMLMFFAAPAWSDSAVHLFHCIAEDATTDEALEAVSSEWLAAAKQMKGGENLQIFLYFPVAVGAAEHDFSFLVIAPDFAQMGVFLDAYAGSPLEEIDDRFDQLAHCPISDLWEAVSVK